MEAAALKQITDLAIAAAEKNRITPIGGMPAIIMDGKVVSTEHLLPGRSRFRGAFSTALPLSFAHYVGQASGIGAVYVNPERLKAVAVLNQGTTDLPGHCDWTADLNLKPTAGYAALLAVNGKKMTQRETTEWLEDWAPILTAIFNGDPAPISRAIAAVRSITIKAKDEASHTVSDFGARQSGLSEIEAVSGAGELPSLIEANVVPAQGLRPRIIPLRLSVITGDKPGIVLRIVSLETIQEAIAIEFRDLLESLLANNVPVHIGDFRP